MTLSDVTLPDLEYVCFNLRPEDARECFAVRPHSSAAMLAWEAAAMIRNAGRGKIAWHNGRPAACIGLMEQRKGVWEIMLFGTQGTKAVAFECMRWAREQLREIVRDHDGKRLQCDSQVGHDEAWKFLIALGATKEGPPMRCFGKDGSDFQRFVWILGENDNVLWKVPENAEGRKAAGATN